jgi:hypothetical protein
MSVGDIVRRGTTLNATPHPTSAGCRIPAHNRPNIRVSSPRTGKSPSRKTRVRKGGIGLLRRVSRWRATRRGRRTLSATPRAVRIVGVAAILLAAFALANLVYHVIFKPTELFFFVGNRLDKEPAETWRQYGPLFRTYSTGTIAPELLAALAQVESTGNPVTRTYWRWRFALNPFAVYQPASSAVGLFQMTDGAYAEARRYCIRRNVVVEDCWCARATHRQARSRSRISPHSSISAAQAPPRPSRTVAFR